MLWDGAKHIIKIELKFIHPWWAGLSSATLRAKAGLKASRSLQSASSCLCVLKKASVGLMKSAESADCSADQQTISKSHLCAPMVLLLFKWNLKIQWVTSFHLRLKEALFEVVMSVERMLSSSASSGVWVLTWDSNLSVLHLLFVGSFFSHKKSTFLKLFLKHLVHFCWMIMCLSVGMAETLKANMSSIIWTTLVCYYIIYWLLLVTISNIIQMIATERNDNDTVLGIFGTDYTLHRLLYLW